MRVFPGAGSFAPAKLAVAALAGVSCLVLHADSAAERQLTNSWEVYHELKLTPGTEAAVKDYLPSFLEYQDLVMFHPRFGYYGSGRVSFVNDYQTFPNVLNPYFGHMIAEQVFRMWKGMQTAGTIGPGDRFTIAEFGAGNGSLAESILAYLEMQSKQNPDQAWRDFDAQVVYACYDRSPALSKTQRERNARFGKRFEAREGDATDPTATVRPGSLKGVVLSNELPDAFGVHKVILSADGTAEVGYVAPSIERSSWEHLKKKLPAAVVGVVENGDRSVRGRFFEAKGSRIYLTRAGFTTLLDSLAPSEEYISAAMALQFNEVYVPAGLVPEVRDHLRRYAPFYATELSRDERGVVAYVNLGMEHFVRGAARMLAAGYVFTLDYGSNWQGAISQDSHPHFRTYGPARQEENRYLDPDPYADGSQPAEDRNTSDPYRGPTLNDMTTDVNFGVMDAEGRLAGLTTLYFGPQVALQAGTAVSLTEAPEDRQDGFGLEAEFYNWARNFATDVNYKLMVQQKAKTDPSFAYPGGASEALSSDRDALNEKQRERAAQIEKKLAGETGPTAPSEGVK